MQLIIFLNFFLFSFLAFGLYFLFSSQFSIRSFATLDVHVGHLNITVILFLLQKSLQKCFRIYVSLAISNLNISFNPCKTQPTTHTLSNKLSELIKLLLSCNQLICLVTMVHCIAQVIECVIFRVFGKL